MQSAVSSLKLDNASAVSAEKFSEQRTAVFWDLDNKQPNAAPPADIVAHLRSLASMFGGQVDILAYANRHAFSWIPDRVKEERRIQRVQESLEKQGLITPEEPYRCPMCGGYFLSAYKLKQHFRSLHEREQKKKMDHIKRSNASRKKKLLNKYMEKSVRYVEAARQVLNPKTGYGLMGDLRRSGVHVRLVSDAPQAADIALKKDMDAAIRSRQVATLCLVSDDRGYSEMLRWAQSQGIKTVIIGKSASLKRSADYFFSWTDLISGRAMVSARTAVAEQDERDALTEELLEMEEDDWYNEELEQSTELEAEESLRVQSAFSEDEEMVEELPFFAKGWRSGTNNVNEMDDMWSSFEGKEIVVEHKFNKEL